MPLRWEPGSPFYFPRTPLSNLTTYLWVLTIGIHQLPRALDTLRGYVVGLRWGLREDPDTLTHSLTLSLFGQDQPRSWVGFWLGGRGEAMRGVFLQIVLMVPTV